MVEIRRTEMSMEGRKILILGAGIYQVPLIRRAKEQGLKTLVSSIPGDYPGFSLAGRVYYADTTDRKAILEIAEKENIDGICTAGTDVAIASVGYVNDSMGLPGVSAAAAARTADKSVMKEAFASAGVDSATSIKAASVEEAMKAAEVTGFPLVVKCVDSSGSRGVNVVDSAEDLEEAFKDSLSFSRKPYVILEDKLPGYEIGIDGLVSGGKLLFLAPHRKSIYRKGDVVITAGHDFPFEGNDSLLSEIRRQTELAVKALGLDNCPVNLDAFVDGDRCHIIEIGARSGATCIPELIEKCYGFNYYDEIIKLSLGEAVDCNRTKSTPCRARLIMSPVDGRITSIDDKGLESIREEGPHISLDYEEGTEINEMGNGTDRLGQVIAEAGDEAQMRKIMDRVYRCIFVNGATLDEHWNNTGF